MRIHITSFKIDPVNITAKLNNGDPKLKYLVRKTGRIYLKGCLTNNFYKTVFKHSVRVVKILKFEIIMNFCRRTYNILLNTFAKLWFKQFYIGIFRFIKVRTVKNDSLNSFSYFNSDKATYYNKVKLKTELRWSNNFKCKIFQLW